MNRLVQLFEKPASRILSVYFTAGYPTLMDTLSIMSSIQDAGADLIEVGIPFSDPVADGPTIQMSNKLALDNGMSMEILFEQLAGMRKKIEIPVILMGYLNPVYQFGMKRFAQKCREVGVDGVILPDLPLDVYREEFKTVFEQNQLSSVFLVTPQTSENRIRQIDDLSDSFIYLVSSSSITGAKGGIEEEQIKYFERIKAMKLRTQQLIGFGISNKETFEEVCRYSSGAIIGSAFINVLKSSKSLSTDIRNFIQETTGKK